jgi:hypothetical protein
LLFALVATLSQCLCPESHYLSIKLYLFMYVTWISRFIYNIQYYLWYHVTAVGLGTYYLQIRGHTCTASSMPVDYDKLKASGCYTPQYQLFDTFIIKVLREVKWKLLHLPLRCRRLSLSSL